MTLIELGEVSSGSEPEVPAAPPRRADLRRIAVLLVAVLCVLTVTGSERPEPRGLPVLWTVDYVGDQFTLTGDTLYVLGAGETPEVTAYDAANGSIRWAREGAALGWLNAEVPGLVLMSIMAERTVPDENGNDFTAPMPHSTVAVDARTGVERWRAIGEINVWTADLIMFMERQADSDGPARFRTVRASDGSTAWTYEPAPGVLTWTTTGSGPMRPDRLITATDDGQIEVRRFGDGSVVTAGKLPWRTAADRRGGYTELFSSHNTLIVITENAGRQTVTGYHPDTLRSVWTTTNSSFNTLFDCGALLCISTGPRQVDAVDPATGRVAWTSEGWDYARETTDGRLITDLHQGGGWQGAIDGATGRKIAEFPPGNSYIDQITGTVLTVGSSSTTPGAATVTQLTGSDDVVLRGSLGAITDNGCQLAADRLACSIGGGLLSVRDVG
jgi:hypothetical protein